MKIIAIANQKGGCGKTTTAINLAACLGKKQRRVLLLDLDPQGHSSLGFGVFNDDARDLYDVFTGESSLENIILPNVFNGVDVVPATMTLAAAEHLPLRPDQRERQLEKHLAPLRLRYDYIVIDCPPTMGLLTLNALMTADLVLIPIEMSLFGLHGIDQMYETIALLRERYAREIPIRVLPTLVDSRTRLCRHFLHQIGERFADDVVPVMVQFTVRLKEAVHKGIPIIEYDPGSVAATQYNRLAEELMACLHNDAFAAVEDEEQARLTAMTQAFDQARARLIENGPRKKVILRFYDLAGKQVQLAGNFNDWKPDKDVVTRVVDGVLEKTILLVPGVYQYRLIVDGAWQEDPSNPEQVSNLAGGRNSILHVESQHETVGV
ncbi:MAG: AAA family ATPase [Gammaproteobacteria bacterium]|nr:AAA family ATPase [Gammaproteobacteria bacterium]